MLLSLGSGKTTLCKAIAQKVYIRNMSDYDSGFLLEINSHSLFSKWFSESGKLVMKLFDHINEIADDPQSFVCILIGETLCILYSTTHPNMLAVPRVNMLLCHALPTCNYNYNCTCTCSCY